MSTSSTVYDLGPIDESPALTPEGEPIRRHGRLRAPARNRALPGRHDRWPHPSRTCSTRSPTP